MRRAEEFIVEILGPLAADIVAVSHVPAQHRFDVLMNDQSVIEVTEKQIREWQRRA